MSIVQRNKEYYNRNAKVYEASSWYYFNKYKDLTVSREINKCLSEMHNESIRILEIGAGTGYLLGKILHYSNSSVDYTCIEHSSAMSALLNTRYVHDKKLLNFRILSDSVNAEYLKNNFKEKSFDFILGSSILHHLPDYEFVIKELGKMVSENGILYFVREPIHRDDCLKQKILSSELEKIFDVINIFFLWDPVKKLFWPKKVKQEDAKNIAIHMFRNGVSGKPFTDLLSMNFRILFKRKYNRRVSTVFSYIENSLLSHLRKDIYNNTLFSIALKKIS